MTYDTEIQKIEMMPFAELYKISSGQRSFYYTSYGLSLDFQGNEYQAVVIKRNTPSFDESLKSYRVMITAPFIDPVNEYLANTPVEQTEVLITRVFPHDLDAYKILFSGQVLGVTIFQGQTVVDAESESVYLRKKFPRIVHQSFCNHTLFRVSEPTRPDCNLNKELFKTEATPTSSGSTLSDAAFALKPDQWFRGGHVETSYGDIRLITSHIGSDLTINLPFDSRLVSGSTLVKAYGGCDKAPATCRDKYNNLNAFLGFSYIPSNNPVVWGFL